LVERAHQREARQQERDELQEDLTPIVNDLYLLTVEQLEEIEPYVRLDDLLRLVKRVARNTRNFEVLLDQFESLQDLVADGAPLTQDMFNRAVLALDEMERRGYFDFAKEAVGIVDRVVQEYSEEDVRQLGDNVVLILNTVKAMTQPEIMRLVGNMTVTFQEIEHEPEALDTSFTGLMRQMRDPEVRRGLALTLRMLKTVSAGQELPPGKAGQA
jgi:uncharacterized protein YjgD (DUF1641 family)